jgi:hypothetical protein
MANPTDFNNAMFSEADFSGVSFMWVPSRNENLFSGTNTINIRAIPVQNRALPKSHQSLPLTFLIFEYNEGMLFLLAV